MPPSAFFGGDLAAQRVVVEDFVADEDDARNAGRRTFVDGEDQIDAVLRTLDDLRIDSCREFAVAAIELDDALNVGLHLGARKDRARLELNFLLQILVGDLAVTLEHDLVDDRVLDDMDGQRRAVPIDLHVGEQTGREQRLQRRGRPPARR